MIKRVLETLYIIMSLDYELSETNKRATKWHLEVQIEQELRASVTQLKWLVGMAVLFSWCRRLSGGIFCEL